MLSDMGINVIDTDEAEEAPAAGEEGAAEAPARRDCRRPDRQGRDPRQGAHRAHRRSRAHVSARDGLGRASVARGRDRHRQAHRGRPRGDDRRPVREPAHLPGHHHLARRAERRQDSAARHHRSRSHLSGPRRQAAAVAAAARRGIANGERSPWRQRPRAAACRRRSPSTPATTRRASRAPEEFDDDDDDLENSLSLAAMEAELKPKVLETFDLVATNYKKLRKLQDQVVERALKNDQLSSGQEKRYKVAEGRDRRRDQVALAQRQPHREPGRDPLRHQQEAARL